jgi:hypothetical protein
MSYNRKEDSITTCSLYICLFACYNRQSSLSISFLYQLNTQTYLIINLTNTSIIKIKKYKTHKNQYAIHHPLPPLHSPLQETIISTSPSKLQNHMKYPQMGGGVTQGKAPQVIDLTTSQAPLITHFENVTYPSHIRQLGVISIAADLRQKTSWSPTTHLAARKGNHIPENLLSPQMEEVIIASTRLHSQDVILFLTENRIQSVTASHIQELLTHGSMTSDSILNTFLDVFCAIFQLHYLSALFYTVLKRDKNWNNVQDWFATGSQKCSSKPSLQSNTILIPCHIQGIHWVGMVRRIIQNQVWFLYADDLNQPSVEAEIKYNLSTYANHEFYPSNAIWLNCKTITF